MFAYIQINSYNGNMIFDIWRLIVKTMPIIGLLGVVVYILGLVGTLKLLRIKRCGKKWGMILICLTILMVLIQMVVTYLLLLNF